MSNPLDKPPVIYPKGTVVAACGCMYSPIGQQEAACRLHGQVREIRSLLETMLKEYDRTGKVTWNSSTPALHIFRRFVG